MAQISVAIDGTAASGKSSTAAEVAQQLGYRHLSTGLLYRAVAVAVAEAGIRVDQATRVEALLSERLITVVPSAGSYRIYLRAEILEHSVLEAAEVGQCAAVLSAQPGVRAYLLPIQSALAKETGLVWDGRDVTTVILPDAELKVFLSASLELRSARRLKQLQQAGVSTTQAEIEEMLRARDKQDQTRSISPLQIAPDARVIDTGNYSQADQVNLIVSWAKEAEKT